MLKNNIKQKATENVTARVLSDFENKSHTKTTTLKGRLRGRQFNELESESFQLTKQMWLFCLELIGLKFSLSLYRILYM